MTSPEISTVAPTGRVLHTVAGMVARILGDYGEDDLDIGMDTSFHEDLEMESIDLVTLAGMLADEYGERVSLAEYLADKDLDEVIALTVGDIVSYVVDQMGSD